MFLIKNILNKIYVHPSCYFLLLLFVFSSYFQVIIIISFLLFIHEIGHFLMASIFKYETKKIVFYPFGGVSYFNHFINIPLCNEILILVMGPIFQLLGFYFLINFSFFQNNITIVKNINYSILLFNLLPIYPLDGGKILNVFINYLIPYSKSFKISYIVSYSFIFILGLNFLYKPCLNLLLVIILLLVKVSLELKKYNYYLEKFYLERYLYKFKFKKTKIIRNSKMFWRDYYHLIKNDNKYLDEREFLDNKYKK